MPDREETKAELAAALKASRGQLAQAWNRVSHLKIGDLEQRAQLRQLNDAILRKNKLIASLRATNADLVKQLMDPAVPLTPSVLDVGQKGR